MPRSIQPALARLPGAAAAAMAISPAISESTISGAARAAVARPAVRVLSTATATRPPTPALPTPTIAKGSQSTRGCTLKEEAPGVVISVSTGQPFTYKDPCVQTGPHLGYNEAAAKATQKAVKDQLRAAFKLE